MRIAIVGGIGSGKSEVLKTARQMGFACLSADEINSELLETPEYAVQVSEIFPSAVKDGNVDRSALAQIVFSDGEALKKLNALAHPRILKRIECEKASPLIVEMPLLPKECENGFFDATVFVDTPLLTRLKRLRKRGMTVRQAMARIRAQVKPVVLGKSATVVIKNSGNLQRLKRRATQVLKELTDGLSAGLDVGDRKR